MASCESERLRLWIAVIKIHDPGWKALSAVRAWLPSEVAKKFEDCRLTASDSLDFFDPMFGVVRDVVEALIVFGPHKQELEHMFIPCQ